MKKDKILTIRGNSKSGFLMYVNGVLMWTCETFDDVTDHVAFARENDFFDENTFIVFTS